MRRLEDHIGPEELASLPESLEALKTNGTHQDLLGHTDQCESCSKLVAIHYQLRGLKALQESEHPSCPSEMMWLEYAEGLRHDEGPAMLAHAADCKTCAQELREVMTLIEPIEAARPSGDLSSFKDDWQKRMAATMAESAQPTSPSRSLRTKRFSWLVAIPVGVTSFVVLACIAVTLWRSYHPSEARLLALAYDQHRMTPLRVPGGSPVAVVSGSRGSRSRGESTALLELKLRAQTHLDQNPYDAYWHQIMGEVSLLENDPHAAEQYFETARTYNASLPGLDADLGAALFGIGAENKDSASYARAAEYYKHALASPGQDSSVLYYNRGLCWERQGLRAEALSDLNKALEAERSEDWRRIIRAEIERLSGQSSIQDPKADHYEDDLAGITEKLLPRWSSDAHARAEIARVAAEGTKKHDDSWLNDWTHAVHSRESQQGDVYLARAIEQSGNPSTSLEESRLAVASYSHAGNLPGRVRALLAETYALQRLDQAGPCLRIAHIVHSNPNLSRYAWIRTQLMLEEGNCEFSSGDIEKADVHYRQAAKLSSDAGLRWLELRALGARAQILEFRGSPIEAWQMNTDSLSLCLQTNCPPVREYLLLYTMAYSAQTLGLENVSLELMRHAQRVAAACGDPTVSAYALETLALVAGRAGNFEESDKAFEAALRAAKKTPSIQSVGLYRAEWDADRAEVLARRGEPQAALDLLRGDERALYASDYQTGRLIYFTALSQAELALRDLDGALENALLAVKEAEKSLPDLATTLEKEQWLRENRKPFEQLVKVYLTRGESPLAFTAWRRYRTLPYSQERASFQFKARTSATDRTSDANVVVIALIDDRYVGWLVRRQSLEVLRTIDLGQESTVRPLVLTFYHLCSDPGARLADVQSIGSKLFRATLEPFSDEVRSSHTLSLDIDPTLLSVAFPALVSPDGSWLGLTHELKLLPAWWSSEDVQPENLAAVLKKGPVLAVNGFQAATLDLSSETADLSQFSSRAILLEQSTATTQAIVENLPTARIFHFTGHATTESGSTRLILPSKSTEHPWVDAKTVAHLDLRLCRLAVLAACNTNASNPSRIEYAPDLRNQLLKSGVRAVIVSHWDVDDRATAVLMDAFYSHLIEESSAPRALALAEQAIQSNPKWQHPYYWASFQFFSN